MCSAVATFSTSSRLHLLTDNYLPLISLQDKEPKRDNGFLNGSDSGDYIYVRIFVVVVLSVIVVVMAVDSSDLACLIALAKAVIICIKTEA